MSIYWNARVKKLSPYIPGEQPRGRQFIKLNTNENPYPPSPKVSEAVQKVLAETDFPGERLRLYPDPSCADLREAVAERYGVKPEQVFVGNGSDEVLAFAFAAFFESGPEAAPALFPDISYSFYPVYAGLWDIPFRTPALTKDFRINADDYAGGPGSSGGAVFPNPNAPTGLALPLNDILKIAEAQKNNRQVLIVDEAYIAFADEPGVESAASRTRVAEWPNLLTVHTLSKGASLAGLRAGFAIASEDLIQGLCHVRDSFNSYTVDRLALAAAAAAIRDPAYYDQVNRKVITTRKRVSAALEGMGFTVLPSQANFIFTCPPEGITAARLFAALREKGILTRHFNNPRIDNFRRISMGTDEEMDRLLEQLAVSDYQ